MATDIREEAANLLSALASDAATVGPYPDTFHPPGNWSRAACEIAYLAHRVDPELTLAEQLADAEARVRDGSLAQLSRGGLTDHIGGGQTDRGYPQVRMAAIEVITGGAKGRPN